MSTSDSRHLDRAGLYGSVTALACVAVFLALPFFGPDVKIQPSETPVPVDEFVRATNTAPRFALVFFTTDAIFVLGYLLTFVGAFASARHRLLGGFMVGGAVALAALDMVENAFFFTYALQALHGEQLAKPASFALFVVANLKVAAALVAAAFLAVAMPTSTRLQRALVATAVLAGLVGAVGLAVPALGEARTLPFLAVLLLLALHFRARLRPLRIRTTD